MDDQPTGHFLRCPGKLKDGRECNVVLAAQIAGLLVIKRRGFEIICGDVRSVTCDRCHTRTELPRSEILQPRIEAIPS